MDLELGKENSYFKLKSRIWHHRERRLSASPHKSQRGSQGGWGNEVLPEGRETHANRIGRVLVMVSLDLTPKAKAVKAE